MRRNILFITIDSLGADKCWSPKGLRLKYFEQIRKKGVVFTHAISTTSSTTPSIASIHTGLYPEEHGIVSTYGCRLKDTAKTLAEIAKENDYTTFAHVSGPLMPQTGLNKGFEKYVYRPAEFMVRFLRWGYPIKLTRINGYLLRKEAPLILKNENPWFYWIHLLDIHNRWRSSKGWRNRSLSGYENALIALDGKIAGIMERVDLKKTLVVISADHGHHISTMDPKRNGVHYEEAHGFHVYDTLVHIPLLMIGDGLIRRGITVDEQISTVDILPSIVDLLGLKNETKTSGQSFAGLMDRTTPGRKNSFSERPVYVEACGSILKRSGRPFLIGIRTAKWKYVIPKDRKSGKHPELYDLTNDPKELENVYEKYPKQARYLQSLLEDMAAKQGS